MKRFFLVLLFFAVSSQAYYNAWLTTGGACTPTGVGTTYLGRDTWVNGVQNSTANNFTQVNYGADTNMSCGSTINTTLAVFNHNCIVAFNMTCFSGLKFVNVTLVAYQTSNSSEGRVGLKNGTNLSVNWVNTPNNWTERNATWYNNTNASYWLYAGGLNLIGARTSSNVTMVNNSRQYYAWNFSNMTWWNLQPDRINGNLTSVTTSYALSTIIANTTTYKWFATRETIAINQAPYLNVTIDEPPFIVTLGENTTTPEPTDWIMLNGTLADDISISGYILSVDNCTGSLSNSSWTAFAGANATNASSKVQIPASCEGRPFQWTYYLNDSQNQWNNAVAHVILVQSINPTVNNFSVNTTRTPQNTVVCLNASVTDKGIGVDDVWAAVVFPNGTVESYYFLDNATSKGVCGGGATIFSAFLSVGDTGGNLSINGVTANDTLGNVGTNTTQKNVTVEDYPQFVFVSQSPADINSSNVIGQNNPLNISYNITDGNGLNYSTIKLAYQTNSSTGIVWAYVNGTSYLAGFVNSTFTWNSSDTFNWTLKDNSVYPACYPLAPVSLENTPHSNQSLGGGNGFVKLRLYNVSNTSEYGWFEVMAYNLSPASGSLRAYYCNSTYSTGNPSSSKDCTNFYNFPPFVSYNHSHTDFTAHIVMPFVANASTGRIGGVVITPTGFFAVRGRNPDVNDWNFSFVSNISRTDSTRISQNNGNTWTNFSGTLESHLHQFFGNDTFCYYAQANDTLGLYNKSTMRCDYMNLSGLPPTAPNVFSPTNASYCNGSTMVINYSASQSPNAYNITNYTIALVYPNETVNSTLHFNGQNLTWNWTVNITPGNFMIRVEAQDNQSQFSYGYSEVFDAHVCTPQFFNVSANPPSPACDAGLIINFTVNWTDEFRMNTSTLTWDGGNVSMDLFAGSNLSGWWYHLIMGLAPANNTWSITGCNALGVCNTTPTFWYNVSNSTPPCSAGVVPVLPGLAFGPTFIPFFEDDEKRFDWLWLLPFALVFLGFLAYRGRKKNG